MHPFQLKDVRVIHGARRGDIRMVEFVAMDILASARE